MLHVAFDVCWFHPVDSFDRLPEFKRRYKALGTRSDSPSAGRPPSEGSLRTDEDAWGGSVLIAHDVLLRYLQELIRYDARHAPFRIIGAEKERYSFFTLSSSVTVKVGGRIDRIDVMDGRLRIVDYKTGDLDLTVDEVYERHEPQAQLYAQMLLGQGFSSVSCAFICVETGVVARWEW